MNIYALKIGENVELVNDPLLKEGIARYGWSYVENANLKVMEKLSWDEMTPEQKDCWKANFLLKIKPGDYIIYINTPSYGKCTLAKVEEPYFWAWDKYQGDFSHCLKVDRDSIKTFDRNAKEINPSLSRRFKLQGKYWQIYLKEEFSELLELLDSGELSGDYANADTRYNKTLEIIEPDLKLICSKIQSHHPEKTMEELVQIILERMPTVSNVERKSGASDKGGDLICEFDTGMDFLGIQRVERCAIQVKSYINEMDYDRAIRDIENVFKAEKDITCGLIISTAEKISERFQEKLDNLKSETGKDVGLIFGKDLARWFIKYGM
ncbi:restriction endonuclease [Ilyobacter sp.]|uniref:restriction endonuclease n=1 Tax=Ilyobacter sp. TaxID=3100343 RepID=UPI003569E470